MEVAEGGMSLSQKKGSYGGNLMPGEGDAMAQYVQTGERTLGEHARTWLKFLVGFFDKYHNF